MIIEQGKKYRCRNGLLVDRVEPRLGENWYIWKVFLVPGQDFRRIARGANIRERDGNNPWFYWSAEGRYARADIDDDMDCLEEIENISVWIMRYKIRDQWFYVTVRHQKDLDANIQAAQREDWQYEVFEIELPKEV